MEKTNDNKNENTNKITENDIKELQKSDINAGEKLSEFNDFKFVQEKIKGRPVDRKKLLKKMLSTAGLAVFFATIACLTFLLVEPLLSKIVKNNSDETQLTEITIPEIEDDSGELPTVVIDTETDETFTLVETPIEDMIVDEQISTSISVDYIEVPVTQEFEIELSDYQLLYKKMYSLSKEVQKSMVTLSGLDEIDDLISNPYKYKTTGLIVGNNGYQILILAEYSKIADMENIRATFYDSSVATAKLICKDEDTHLAIYSVAITSLSSDTKNSITVATLGASYENSVLGGPVIAVGCPLGNVSSVCYGQITSASGKVSSVDASYQLLVTDIYCGSGSNGFLVNSKGQFIGIITPEDGGLGLDNMVKAFGFSSIRKLLEKLTNNSEIVYAGIYITDINAEALEQLDMPRGAYIIKVDNGSPSMNVGLTTGDIIVKIGDKSIYGTSDYMNALAEYGSGDSITIVYARKSGDEYKESTVEITLETK